MTVRLIAAAALLMGVSATPVSARPMTAAEQAQVQSWVNDPSAMASAMSKVRAVLDANLNDYTSARFRGVHLYLQGVCGWMNARNAMGGYTGWEPFGVRNGLSGLILVQGALAQDCGAPVTDADLSDMVKYQG